MAFYLPTREDDERLLAMLHLRDRGWKYSQIAQWFGATKNTVAGALNRIDVEYARSEAAA